MGPFHHNILYIHNNCLLFEGNFEVAKVLIDHGANLNIQDKFGLTPILLATSKGHLETVTLLENRGADYSVSTCCLKILNAFGKIGYFIGRFVIS